MDNQQQYRVAAQVRPDFTGRQLAQLKSRPIGNEQLERGDTGPAAQEQAGDQVRLDGLGIGPLVAHINAD